MDTRVVFGGPGCGKTQRLTALLRRELSCGVAPGRVAFASFTKAAAEEARDRVVEELGLRPDDLGHFGTVHSLAFRALGLKRDDVMSFEDWRDFSEIVGEPVTGRRDADHALGQGRAGDQLLALVELARARRVDLEGLWRCHPSPPAWRRVTRFVEALRLYKSERGRIDFSDMLEEYLTSGAPLDVDVAIVDEAQDLTPVQWRVVERAFSRVERRYVAGDDDQAIFTWSGADASYLIDLPGEREVLPVSHRLPKTVHGLAQRLVGRLNERVVKNYRASAEEGAVNTAQYPETVKITDGTWFLLARHRFQLERLAEVARDAGVPYTVSGRSAVDSGDVLAIQAWEALRAGSSVSRRAAAALAERTGLTLPEGLERLSGADLGVGPEAPIWHDALVRVPLSRREYYLGCLRRGESLTTPPRVTVATIHAVKGREADHVLLLTDVTRRVEVARRRDPDAEHRVFYVAVTRARKTLTIVRPLTPRAYHI